MSFKPYIADREVSFLHIKEMIKKTKNKELRTKINDIISLGFSEHDIAANCWIKAWDENWEASSRHRKEYCGKVISDMISNRVARKTTSVMTYYAIKNIHKKMIRSKSIESRFIMDNSFDFNDILSSGMSYDQAKSHLLLELKINKNSESSILLDFIINDLDEIDAMKSLNCSRRTLYRKQLEFFNYLKKKFYKYKR